MEIGDFESIFAALGEVPEWLKGPAWKAGIGATLSGVRIPLSPLLINKNQVKGLVFLIKLLVIIVVLYKLKIKLLDL